MSSYDRVFFFMIQTLRQEKRVKNMGAATPGDTRTVLLLGGGECGNCCIVSDY